MAVESLSKIIEGKLEPEKMKIATIPAATKRITHLSNREVTKYISGLKS